ncbi:hypothetical protein BSN85_35145 [Bradyrhizobium brasilense]|nr:hypothetical protein BSN85_35145 [Bradyrhizobium brasilense]
MRWRNGYVKRNTLLVKHCYIASRLGFMLAAGMWASVPAIAQTSAIPVAATTRFATVAEPSESIAAGDLVRVISYFGAWTLVCDNRLSTRRRVCAIEQHLAEGDVSLLWRIGLTDDGKPTLSIDVSGTVDQLAGLTFRVGKFVTTIPFESCVATCRAVVPFDGFIQQGVLGGELVGFAFTLGGKGTAIVADMNGFKQVMAAAQHPVDLASAHPASPARPARAVSRSKARTGRLEVRP